MIFAEIFKFLGAVIATVVAITATYYDDTKAKNRAGLTRKGRWMVMLALLGLVIASSAQIAQIIDAIDSTEKWQLRHEETVMKLGAVTESIRFESLSATRLRRFTIICYFEPSIKIANLKNPSDLAVQLVFMRGSQSEMRVRISPDGSGKIGGRFQLEGREQRVELPIEQAVVYSGIFNNFEFQGNKATSLWVDIAVQTIIPRLKRAPNGSFKFWPYYDVGDFADVWVNFDTDGKYAGKLSDAYLRLNEDLVVDLLEKVKGDSRHSKNSILQRFTTVE